MEHSQLNSAIKQHAFRKMQQIQTHLDVLSVDVSVVILPSCSVHHHSGQYSPRHQPQGTDHYSARVRCAMYQRADVWRKKSGDE
jgi:hypothetical protein